MQCHGTVQGNVVILEEGVSLPDGLRVTVTVEQEAQPAPADIPQEALAQRHALENRCRRLVSGWQGGVCTSAT